ncbi:hypothetical protein QJS10_CPA10g00460 [Acorus calamus]|uniref:Protein PARTING DANCERS-like n=1 Tax=Acorus calamus TaxID=4465 RepID=A0AAV9DYK6_ACOCL|nr:hypothetical protein QJS10_CPA10g00460 [Acorus calamus]
MESSSRSNTGSGVCMMNNEWKNKHHASFINFIASFLSANSYRLNFLPIAPDFIFNNGGISVAFVFVTNWDSDNVSPLFNRVEKLKGKFRHFYIIVTVPTVEQNASFTRSYFKYGMELGNPTFVPVLDPEMGFERIVNIAHGIGVCKREDAIAKMKAECKSSVQSMEAFLKVVTAIPGIDNHDANMLIQAIGSIEAISKASKNYILENTDLSAIRLKQL